ncbi:MAG: aminotransferase class III-fold pyridoxal phosphate-dependent enzyme [Burkholderiales bacterium]|nr:aminotransferase class III-fold pyridoxal phosphate-dependent enzyme [Phycisphaerae bacterium]
MLTPLQEMDRRHHLHPFTDHNAMHKSGTQVAVRGDGCYLIDQDNRRLLDGLAGLWCVNVGYSRKEIVDAVTAQMTQLPYYCSFFNTTTEPAIRLAAKLAELAPQRVNHSILCNSGSEANDTAIKLIWAYNKILDRPNKRKILSRTFSYHGVTVATTSMTGLPSCYLPFDLPLPGFIHVPGPYTYGANNGMTHDQYGDWCIAETERIIQHEGAETVAAMFVEPIQGAGGVIVPPDGYLTKLRALLRKYDILFVADEVISAFGRLGAWFASDMWQLDPDIITLAKGITSGYLPLGATMLSDQIVETLNRGGYLAHGYTYSSHPTPCAAALANLKIIEDERLVERTRDDTGPYFQKKLRSLIGHPAVGEVRGYQMIGAIELLPKGGRSELAKSPNTLGVKAAGIAREHGVIVRGIRDLIAMSPPLIATHEEIDELFVAIAKTLDQI